MYQSINNVIIRYGFYHACPLLQAAITKSLFIVVIGYNKKAKRTICIIV